MTAQRQRVGSLQNIDLTQFIYGTRRDGSILLVSLSGKVKVPLFRDEASMGLFYYEVYGPGVVIAERIGDSDMFLQDIPGDIEIVTDPHRTQDGRWAFHLILRN